jgi:lipid II isoglutaminyl synthase (glutamine-hydrolysing)
MEHLGPISIRICHLYPKLLSVAGDRGNLFAITRRCAWRGIQSSVIEADVGEVPDFTEFDLILLHGGQDCEMRVAARDLGMKAGSLQEAIEADAVVLAVCAGYQLLGKHYAPAGAAPIAGIGVLDAVTEGGSSRFMSHIAVACDLGRGGQRRLVGFENHSGRTYLGPGADPLGRVIAGSGNNGEDGTEGARYRQVYATYLHGPLLPKNPWLTDHLISMALLHRYPDAQSLDLLTPLEDQTEAAAHAAALRLACRPTGRWRTAMAARPRWRRAGSRHAETAKAPYPQTESHQAEARAQQAKPADQGAGGAQSADKRIAWTSR